MSKLDITKDTITYSQFQTRPEGGRAIPAQLRVLSMPYRGTIALHIREFYLDEEGNYAPGRGVKFSREALEETIKGLLLLDQALKEAEDG